MHQGRNEDERQKMQEFLLPANTLSFAQKEPEIDLTDGQGRTRVYFLDGRKLEKAKDGSREELAAKWDEYRLVTEEKGPRGDKVQRDFEVAPGGQQLYETLHFTIGRNKTPASVRYVYDRGLGPKAATAH